MEVEAALAVTVFFAALALLALGVDFVAAFLAPADALFVTLVVIYGAESLPILKVFLVVTVATGASFFDSIIPP